MKVIAYFLPQFHEVEENNLWWGKGFTEWNNVKLAKPYFKGHLQPNIPENSNYYNLLEKETMEWQANLANENGIYGFCYYHYWFNGRKLLDKPAEILLLEKNIPQNFCFCWANHTWRRSWNGSSEILIEQVYGEELEWKEHINYLMKFFKDKRYIKVNNKPMLMIYDTHSITRLEDRIKFYEQECIKQGFEGIYIIESLSSEKQVTASTQSQAVTLREPAIALSRTSLIDRVIKRIKANRRNKFLKPHVYEFNKIVENSIEFATSYSNDKEIMLGSFTGWDSTPRHKNRGYVIKNNDVEKFEKYLLEQKKIIKGKGKSEYIFINAWNEWGEGMMLEPTQQYGMKYLNAIKKVVGNDIKETEE